MGQLLACAAGNGGFLYWNVFSLLQKSHVCVVLFPNDRIDVLDIC